MSPEEMQWRTRLLFTYIGVEEAESRVFHARRHAHITRVKAYAATVLAVACAVCAVLN